MKLPNMLILNSSHCGDNKYLKPVFVMNPIVGISRNFILKYLEVCASLLCPDLKMINF